MKKLTRHYGRSCKTFIFILLLLLMAGMFVFRINVKAHEDKPQAYYTSIQIHEGDTLWGIAERYAPLSEEKDIRAYVDCLYRMNPSVKAKALIPGSWLTVVYHE